MKYRILPIILSVIICMNGGVIAYANEAYKNDSTIIEQRYEAVGDYNCNLSISKNVAYYKIVVSSKVAYKITVNMELQQKSGSKWIKLKTKKFTGYKIENTFSDECDVDDNNAEYRVYYKITAYYDDETEVISGYKYN